ncbi:hypothetical protein [Flavobacterium gelatinilyticum]|uniref:hypothetical protein n=1 Tax=Flavobacterium gelatinilyticum TaxID=3003260 RepID=UPI00247FE0C3|nr:hypothetical protein [Flavobacterium gelatinilyticum]
MTAQQIKNKISDLEQWLRDNPNHMNRTTIESDLRDLRKAQQIKSKANKYAND